MGNNTEQTWLLGLISVNVGEILREGPHWIEQILPQYVYYQVDGKNYIKAWSIFLGGINYWKSCKHCGSFLLCSYALLAYREACINASVDFSTAGTRVKEIACEMP